MLAHDNIRSFYSTASHLCSYGAADVSAVELHLRLRPMHHVWQNWRENAKQEAFLYPPPQFPIKLTQALIAFETLSAKVSKVVPSFLLVGCHQHRPWNSHNTNIYCVEICYLVKRFQTVIFVSCVDLPLFQRSIYSFSIKKNSLALLICSNAKNKYTWEQNLKTNKCQITLNLFWY